jgi:hypothetical protein
MMLLFSSISKLLSNDERFASHVKKSADSIARDLTWLPQLTDQLVVTELNESLPAQPKVDWHAPENFIELKTDYPRACSFLEAVARGVLFHDKKIIWKGAVLIVPLFFGRLETNEGRNISQELSSLIAPDSASGENKDIFYYEVTALPEGVAEYQVDVCFYQEFKAVCWFFTHDKKELVETAFKGAEFVVWSDGQG